MMSTVSHRAFSPAVRSAGRAYTTVALRPAARSPARLNTLSYSSAKAIPSHPSQNAIQQRARGTWHSPGCSWAASTTSGDAKRVPRDQDCPACQHGQEDPFDMSPHKLMAQHKRQMLEMRRLFERDPYESLFGLSNRRLTSLWDRHFSLPDLRSVFQARAAVHSTSKAQTSASPTRRVPVDDESTQRANVTWSSSGVDKSGKPFEKSGSFVYDPVTGRMTKSEEEVDHVSTTAAPATVVGKVVHQKLVEEQGSPEIKYARPSMDPDEIPEDSISKSQQAKIREYQVKEAKLEAAKERADTAIGIEQDARESNFHDRTAKDDIIPSGAPPRNINNELGRLVNLEFDEQGPADKYVTPSVDSTFAPPPAEKIAGSVRQSIDAMKLREKELAQAKKTAESAVGVEEDAAAAGWTNDKPSSVSTAQDLEPRTNIGHSARPISNDQFLDSSKYNRHVASAAQTMGGSVRSSMDRIQAKEREFEERKRNLNTLKVKQHDMEQSWKREQGPRSTFTGDVRSTPRWPSPQELDHHARLREQRTDKAKAWASFKNATPSKRYPTVDDALHDILNGVSDKRRAESTWRPAASSDEPSRGFMSDRTPGALSVFTKEKPLKSMSMSDLNRDRTSVMQNWGGIKTKPSPKPPSATDNKLMEEVDAQKEAMSWFENKWRLWSKHSEAAPKAPQASQDARATRDDALEHSAGQPTSAAPIAAEGDIAHNVADYATSDRWYKNKAPHAYGVEEQKMRDAELVASIREIYERAYGPLEKVQSVASETAKTETSEAKNEKKPSVHATLKDLESMPNTESQGHTSGSSPDSTQELSAYRLSQDGKVIPTFAGDLSKYAKEPTLSPAQALVKVHNPSAFADFIADLDEQICYANGSIVITRRSTGKQPAAIAKSRIFEPAQPNRHVVSQRNDVNPVDGTRAVPDLTPQTGNFASPTGFVNHDVFTAESSKQKSKSQSQPTSRKVRKDEPVFSGAIPAQKYSVPEIVNMFNERGVAGTGPQRNSKDNKGYEQDQRRKDRTFVRIMRKVILVGGWTAGCCYALGVVVEYFRAGPAHGVESTAAWEDRSFGNLTPASIFGGSKKEGEKSRVDKTATREPSYFEDMPMRGMEYPLLGILAGCVWYLIANSQ